MALWRAWRAAAERRRRAAAFVAALLEDPSASDVQWLAAHGTSGDTDHARWELRYLRRSLGLLTAQHDALDDRTGSVVAQAMSEALADDPDVAPDRQPMAERQMNSRLHAYGEALADRSGAGSGWHLGTRLLEYSGRRGVPGDADVEGAAEIAARYLAEANETLRAQFGQASLPEDVAPSALRSRG